jgi:hypothetical protein
VQTSEEKHGNFLIGSELPRRMAWIFKLLAFTLDFHDSLSSQQ